MTLARTAPTHRVGWTFAISSIALFMTVARQPRRDHGAARHPPELRRVALPARVDRQRLHPHVRRPAPHRRRARRPVRSQADVHHRPRALHRAVGDRGHQPDHRRPHRRPGDPGRRRRDRHAADPDHPLGAPSRRSDAASPSARGAPSPASPSPSGRSSAGPSPKASAGSSSSGSTSRSASSDPARLVAPERDLRPARRARPARPRPRHRRPVRPRVGPHPRQRARLDQHRIVTALVPAPSAPDRVRRSGRPARAEPMLPLRFFRSRAPSPRRTPSSS